MIDRMVDAIASQLGDKASVLRPTAQQNMQRNCSSLSVPTTEMLRNICPVVARAAGRLTAPARRPAPSAFAAAANSRPFSSEELVPGVGKGKTSTGLVSA